MKLRRPKMIDLRQLTWRLLVCCSCVGMRNNGKFFQSREHHQDHSVTWKSILEGFVSTVLRSNPIRIITCPWTCNGDITYLQVELDRDIHERRRHCDVKAPDRRIGKRNQTIRCRPFLATHFYIAVLRTLVSRSNNHNEWGWIVVRWNLPSDGRPWHVVWILRVLCHSLFAYSDGHVSSSSCWLGQVHHGHCRE